MDSQPLTKLSQTTAEAQMRVLEIVLQIIILSTLVLFATTFVIIIWLCFRELRQPRPGRPCIQDMEDEKAEIPVSIDSYWQPWDLLLCKSVLALVCRLGSTSIFPFPMIIQSHLGTHASRVPRGRMS